MFHFESWDSDRSSSSDISSASLVSYGSSDLTSVFEDEDKDIPRKPEQLKFTAQQLAEISASNHFPTFDTGRDTKKCAMLHWACHVGWCLCKYQYQPLTPLHLLPSTPITDNCYLRHCNMKTVAAERAAAYCSTFSKSSLSRTIEQQNAYETSQYDVHGNQASNVKASCSDQAEVYERETTV